MTTKIGIEQDRVVLQRILLSLVAMAGIGAKTLPRRLRNAVLRLVRPAEWATRRLIIATASALAPREPARPHRPRPPNPNPLIVKNGVGTGLVMPRGLECGLAGSAVRPARRSAPQALPILDPLRRYRPPQAGRVLPRISLNPDLPFGQRKPARPEPMPWDLLDAAPLARRLGALSRALENLPAEAERFARWQARQARARQALFAPRNETGTPTREEARARLKRFRWPLRGGEPNRSGACPDAELATVLEHAHRLATFALERPDTS